MDAPFHRRPPAIVSLRPGRIRGVSLHEPASCVSVDRTLQEVSVANYDALLIPGGFINPDLLRQSEAARRGIATVSGTRWPRRPCASREWRPARVDLRAPRSS
jgi:protease I